MIDPQLFSLASPLTTPSTRARDRRMLAFLTLALGGFVGTVLVWNVGLAWTTVAMAGVKVLLALTFVLSRDAKEDGAGGS
jgi:cyanate permease